MSLNSLYRQGQQFFDYLNQGELWIPDGTPPVRIADMDLAWRHNAAAFLVRHADGYLFNYSLGELALLSGPFGPTPGTVAHDDLDQTLAEVDAERTEDPQAWMKATPLYESLVAGLPEGTEREALAAAARHWSDCPVRTGADGACPCAGRKAEAAKAGEA